MRLFDANFRRNSGRYMLQCVLATVVVMFVLSVLDSVLSTTIIAALGASAFIAFTMPHKPASQPRRLVGGYAMGTLAGLVCDWLSRLPLWSGVPLVHQSAQTVFGALAVGLAIFLMVVTDTEHPPAAGLALGYVLNEVTFLTVVVVFLGIILLTGTKTVLRSVLIDL